MTDEQVKKAIEGYQRNVNHMIRIPGNIAGYKGIATTGRKIKKWKDKLGQQTAGLYLAQLVRMQRSARGVAASVIYM